jgi:hypothetical protein
VLGAATHVDGVEGQENPRTSAAGQDTGSCHSACTPVQGMGADLGRVVVKMQVVADTRPVAAAESLVVAAERRAEVEYRASDQVLDHTIQDPGQTQVVVVQTLALLLVLENTQVADYTSHSTVVRCKVAGTKVRSAKIPISHALKFYGGELTNVPGAGPAIEATGVLPPLVETSPS